MNGDVFQFLLYGTISSIPTIHLVQSHLMIQNIM